MLTAVSERHRAKGTGQRAQGTGRRAQDAGRRAKGNKDSPFEEPVPLRRGGQGDVRKYHK